MGEVLYTGWSRMFGEEKFGMPHGGVASNPWIEENGEGTRRLLILETWWRWWAILLGGECQEKGGVSVQMFDA